MTISISFYTFKLTYDIIIILVAGVNNSDIHLKYNWLVRGYVGSRFTYNVFFCMEQPEGQFQMCVGPQRRFCEDVSVNCTYSQLDVNYFNSLWYYDHRHPYTNDNLSIVYRQRLNHVEDIYVDKSTPVNVNI